MRVTVGEPVARDDGRHYVPVMREIGQDGVPSQIVLRVASDAFASLEEAVAFAEHVGEALNAAHANVPVSTVEFKYALRDQRDFFYKKVTDRNDVWYEWEEESRASVFSTVSAAKQAARHYVDKENALNYGLHVLEIVRLEITRQGRKKIAARVVEVLPEKYETILGEFD